MTICKQVFIRTYAFIFLRSAFGGRTMGSYDKQKFTFFKKLPFIAHECAHFLYPDSEEHCEMLKISIFRLFRDRRRKWYNTCWKHWPEKLRTFRPKSDVPFMQVFSALGWGCLLLAYETEGSSLFHVVQPPPFMPRVHNFVNSLGFQICSILISVPCHWKCCSKHSAFVKPFKCFSIALQMLGFLWVTFSLKRKKMHSHFLYMSLSIEFWVS